jgi:hypothetical protein
MFLFVLTGVSFELTMEGAETYGKICAEKNLSYSMHFQYQFAEICIQ